MLKRLSRGLHFIKQKTGSATQVNLDGRAEHNFVDDKEPFEKDNNKE
ncbi:MAG: hypothetical protein K9L17_04745 [Clostridiales bacterium]|nr:hypothetical protein [Clostridiales bacterium]MCF8021983.1 hypothetical protein [Clostridiales bacterium]